MIKDELVVKANSLIEAKMKFSPNEYKLITYLASKIKKDDCKFRTFEISIQELNKYCFGINGKKTYTYMKNQYAYTLSKKDIVIKKGSGIVIYNWFTVVDTSVKGVISVCFSPDLKEFLLQTKDNFTSYRLSNILDLNSFYSIRLYEILKQYEKLGKRELTLDNLKFMLGIEKEANKRYSNFKRAIESSIEAINENTDIKVKFDEHKIGRITKSLVFSISAKVQSDIEIDEIKERIEVVLGDTVSSNILKKTIQKFDLKKESIYYYLDNWSAFDYKSKENPIGFLLNCVIKKEPIPVRKEGNYKPAQSYNFEQRVYDDEYFDNLYDNFRNQD
jgi:plasmid replication initiation protein